MFGCLVRCLCVCLFGCLVGWLVGWLLSLLVGLVCLLARLPARKSTTCVEVFAKPSMPGVPLRAPTGNRYMVFRLPTWGGSSFPVKKTSPQKGYSQEPSPPKGFPEMLITLSTRTAQCPESNLLFSDPFSSVCSKNHVGSPLFFRRLPKKIPTEPQEIEDLVQKTLSSSAVASSSEPCAGTRFPWCFG